MRVCLSVDMEGVSQITNPCEVKAFCREYWDTGQRWLNDDVVAAASGLLAGGATDVIVLDNHASGNTFNIVPEALPQGARVESWNVFDLADRGVEAMLQVGYHARCGEVGFISHTYVGRLHLRVNGDPISESHGRAWGAGVPLVGIVGNDSHASQLGPLGEAPYLVVQQTVSRGEAMPSHSDPALSRAAIADFSATAIREVRNAPLPEPPVDFLFEASIASSVLDSSVMDRAGWQRVSDTDFEQELSSWKDARGPLAAAMAAAPAPWRRSFSSDDLRTRDAFEAFDPGALSDAREAYLAWIAEPQSDWL